MLIVAQTTQNISNFMVGKLSLQEIATLAIIREISNYLETGRYGWKIWSLPDYPGELTALFVHVPRPFSEHRKSILNLFSDILPQDLRLIIKLK